MPEINPLTNNQIFLKKIAENTGSDYDTGDVSEINPLTIDQIFLKEIAANTAGQSGDITELEGKVADNTSAIEALSDTMAANGAHNLLPYPYTDTTNSFYTDIGDGLLTIEGSISGSNQSFCLYSGKADKIFHKPGKYIVSAVSADTPDLPAGLAIFIDYGDGNFIQLPSGICEITISNTMMSNTIRIKFMLYAGFAVSPAFTLYPMIRLATDPSTAYTPYAMTNRELTERVERGSVSVATDGVKTWKQIFNDLYVLLDMTKITNQTLLTIGSDICQLTGYSHPAGLLFVSSGFGASGSDLYVWIQRMRIHSLDSSYFLYLTNTSTASDKSNNVPSSGITITLYY